MQNVDDFLSFISTRADPGESRPHGQAGSVHAGNRGQIRIILCMIWRVRALQLKGSWLRSKILPTTCVFSGIEQSSIEESRCMLFLLVFMLMECSKSTYLRLLCSLLKVSHDDQSRIVATYMGLELCCLSGIWLCKLAATPHLKTVEDLRQGAA